MLLAGAGWGNFPGRRCKMGHKIVTLHWLFIEPIHKVARPYERPDSHFSLNMK